MADAKDTKAAADTAADEQLSATPSEENPTAPAPPAPPAPKAPEDTRQRWVCVDTWGKPTGHPVFHDDGHLAGHQPACPVCGSAHVDRAEAYDTSSLQA